LQLAHPEKLSPKYILFGLFFLKARERGVRERGVRSNSSNNTLGSKQLKSYFIRELFS
jgi:hypothetical protein